MRSEEVRSGVVAAVLSRETTLHVEAHADQRRRAGGGGGGSEQRGHEDGGGDGHRRWDPFNRGGKNLLMNREADGFRLSAKA